ncbi:MAG: ABC transporter permease, partial [Coxiellaceae bacterium]|nr:ABC transporter permease [Coxiellaceae bacterium]
TLTLFGGLLGVMLGELVAFVTAHFSGWAFHVYSVPLFIGFSVSALVGMFFGIYPAHKASQSDPILCLRSD